MSGYGGGGRDRMVAALRSEEPAASLPVGASPSAAVVGDAPQPSPPLFAPTLLVEVGAELRIRSAPDSRFASVLRGRVARTLQVRRGRRKVAVRYDPIGQAGDWLTLPRGLMNVVRDTAQRVGLQVETRLAVVGHEDEPRDPEEVARRAGRPLRPYQAEAVRLLNRRIQGHVVIPCGGGKTWAGAVAIASNGGAALVLVGTNALRDQWSSVLREVGVRVVAGGAVPRRGEAVVALPGTVTDRQVQETAIFLVDEAHHTPCDSIADVASRSRARWRWGLTATPDRADGRGFMLDYLLGPCLLRVPHEHLIANGWIYRPALVPVLVPYTVPAGHRAWIGRCPTCQIDREFTVDAFPRSCPTKGCRGTLPAEGLRPGRVNWPSTLSGWATSAVLVEHLRALLRWAQDNGRTVLVLVPRVEVARSLAATFSAEGLLSQPLVGGEQEAGRRIRDLRKGRILALFGTSIADEALDIPEVDLVIIASLGKAKGTHEQRAGRATRPKGHQVPIVVDLVPDGVIWQWPARRQAFVTAFGGTIPDEPVGLPAALAMMNRLHRR